MFSLDVPDLTVLGTCQKLAGGRGGGWKTGEDHRFLSPSKERVMKKIDRKRGRVTRN